MMKTSCWKVAGKAPSRTTQAPRMKRKHASTYGRLPRPRRQAYTRKPSRGARVTIGESPRSTRSLAAYGPVLIPRPDGESADLELNVEELINL